MTDSSHNGCILANISLLLLYFVIRVWTIEMYSWHRLKVSIVLNTTYETLLRFVSTPLSGRFTSQSTDYSLA